MNGEKSCHIGNELYLIGDNSYVLKYDQLFWAIDNYETYAYLPTDIDRNNVIRHKAKPDKSE